MKWVFVFKEKNKVALCLLAAVLSIMLINFILSNKLEAIDKNVSSIYLDRLIPAAEMSLILEQFYSNRLLIEDHINTEKVSELGSLEEKIFSNGAKVDSLISRFEKTYLVNEEKADLGRYYTNIASLRQVQKTTLELSRDGQKKEAREFFRGAGILAFFETKNTIMHLSQIQASIGEKLVKNSQQNMAGTKLLSILEICIAVVIAIVIQIIIQVGKYPFERERKFTLN